MTHAHSFGQLYTLPIPLELYAWGAAIALLASFVIAAFMLRRSHAPKPVARRFDADVPLWFWTFVVLRLLAVGALTLTIAAGFIGHPNSSSNIAMPMFWIVFGLGFFYLSALIGGLYERINPWRSVADSLANVLPAFRDGVFRYPVERLGYWPALLLYGGFIWMELFGHIKPFSLAVWLSAYSGLTLTGCLLFGAKTWCRYGELFSVLLRMVSMIAPLRLEQDTDQRWRWALRWPFTGLFDKQPGHLSLVLFVLFMLASTAYDGFHGTVPWLRFFWSTLIPAIDPDANLSALYTYRDWFQRWQWFGLLLAPLAYFGAYWLAVRLGKTLARSDLPMRTLLRGFSFSLIPIAVVYHASHYYTLLQTEGIRVVPRLSDPFGWYWDLFGTADWFRYTIIPDMDITWHAQVGLIIFGHIASVFIAHREAIRIFGNARQAALSQIPMLLLMMAYTAAGLWILALPLEAVRLL